VHNRKNSDYFTLLQLFSILAAQQNINWCWRLLTNVCLRYHLNTCMQAIIIIFLFWNKTFGPHISSWSLNLKIDGTVCLRQWLSNIFCTQK
jgi:hypothetical protein